MKAYYPSYFLLSVAGQTQTQQVHASYDDSYLGEEEHADTNTAGPNVVYILLLVLSRATFLI